MPPHKQAHGLFVDEDAPTSNANAVVLHTKKGHVKGKDKVHVADTPMYISKRKGVYEPYNTSTLSSSLVLQQTESEGL